MEAGGSSPETLGRVSWGSLMGGGWATVTEYVAANQVLCTILQPFPLIPNSPGNTPIPLPTGQWSFDKPVGTVSGLDYLDGLFVSGIADGTPILPPQPVVGGSITPSGRPRFQGGRRAPVPVAGPDASPDDCAGRRRRQAQEHSRHNAPPIPDGRGDGWEELLMCLSPNEGLPPR